MSDLFPSYPDGFQAEDAEHVPARDPVAQAPPQCYQAEDGEHSPLEEESAAENA